MSKPNNRQTGERNRPKNQPAARQADVVSAAQTEVMAASWQGPLPPPATLREFDDVVPGAALRILDMAEKQSAHRIQIEKTVIDGDSRRADRGLVVGGNLAALIVTGGLIVMITRDPWAGASIIGTSVATLAGVFVYGTNTRRAERNRKAGRVPRAGES